MIPISLHDNKIYKAIEFNPRGSQCLRKFLGKTDQNPSVSKSKVVIFRFFLYQFEIYSIYSS